MASCYAKTDRYFFPRDLSVLHGKSLVVGITAYRVIKVALFLFSLAIISYNQTTILYSDCYGSFIQDEFIYLTEWGVWLTFFYFSVSIANMLSHQWRGKPLWNGIWKLETVLFLTALTYEFTITVVFWSVLYRYEPQTTTNFLGNVVIHLLPCLFLWIGSLINPIVVDNFRPIIYITFIGAVYFSVNLIYSLVVKAVYPPMTFRDWWTLAFVAGAVLLVLIQFTIYKAFYAFRKRRLV